jgi:phosphatidylserine/phosphatidylglycerophosphate/cardiolipin synthase-like enzyme
MAATIRIAAYTNADDAFVAWAPLERGRKSGKTIRVEPVENRVGFAKDKPKSGDHRPSDFWPFQRFNWTDHAVEVGHQVRYRVTAMIDNGSGRPYEKGPLSAWTKWATLSADCGGGFSCYFNRGLALSQFAARYMRDKKLSPAQFKARLKTNVDPKFRAFLEGDLGAQILTMLKDAKGANRSLHLALYELDDQRLEDAIVASKSAHVKVILANGSDKSGDGNEAARAFLNDHGIPTIDRILKSKGLGHNKFAVLSDSTGPAAIWTGSTNWSTTGLCTQINNGLLITDRAIGDHYFKQWTLLESASPPSTDPANFTAALTTSNDAGKNFAIRGASVRVRFTRTTDGGDMEELRDLINGAKHSILFLMFTPGAASLHVLAGKRSNEEGMYVRGVVSTVGTTKEDTDKNYVDVRLISSDAQTASDRYTVVQPQSAEQLGPWIAEVTRRQFLSQIGHAIVHSKVLVIDPLSANCAVATGSHNFSTPASEKNDENFVIVRKQRALAEAYAAHVMSVYQHYRYRSYVRDTLARGEKPWSALDDDDKWLETELKSKALEIAFWA